MVFRKAKLREKVYNWVENFLLNKDKVTFGALYASFLEDTDCDIPTKQFAQYLRAAKVVRLKEKGISYYKLKNQNLQSNSR